MGLGVTFFPIHLLSRVIKCCFKKTFVFWIVVFCSHAASWFSFSVFFPRFFVRFVIKWFSNMFNVNARYISCLVKQNFTFFLDSIRTCLFYNCFYSKSARRQNLLMTYSTLFARLMSYRSLSFSLSCKGFFFISVILIWP